MDRFHGIQRAISPTQRHRKEPIVYNEDRSFIAAIVIIIMVILGAWITVAGIIVYGISRFS